MRVKKPFLLAVLVVALLAVALILPATAAAADGHPPTAWVSYGGSAVPAPGVLHQQSVSVHLYPDGSIRGHATLQVIKNPAVPRMIAMAGQGDFLGAVALDDHTFRFVASFDALVWVPGDEENGPTLVSPWMVLECTYHDGDGVDPDWFTISPLGLGGTPQRGNIEVHVN